MIYTRHAGSIRLYLKVYYKTIIVFYTNANRLNKKWQKKNVHINSWIEILDEIYIKNENHFKYLSPSAFYYKSMQIIVITSIWSWFIPPFCISHSLIPFTKNHTFHMVDHFNFISPDKILKHNNSILLQSTILICRNTRYIDIQVLESMNLNL